MKLSNELEVFGLTADLANKDIQVRKIACKYWNKGYCKNRGSCKLEHPQEDCKTHKSCEQCIDETCNKRHRKTCRDWLRDGCRRKEGCEYLHQDTKETEN